MSAAENWNLITDADDGDGTPAIDRFLAAAVAKKLRSKWNQTQTVVVEYKRGHQWHSASVGIEMPEERKGVTPEGGAQYLVSVAREFSASHDHNARIRLSALGESQSGATSKSLWTHGLDFTDDLDDLETAPSPKDDPRRANESEVTAAMELLRKGSEDAFAQRNTAIEQTTALVDKLVDLAQQAADNQTNALEALRLEVQDRRETREADAASAESSRHAKRVDKVFESVVDVGSKLLEQTLRTKFGMGSDVFEGSYSSRLAAILKKVPAEKQAAAKQALGDDLWEKLQAAANNVSDDAFRELMRQAAAAMPDEAEQKRRFVQLAVTLGDQGVVAALGKLITEASN